MDVIEHLFIHWYLFYCYPEAYGLSVVLISSSLIVKFAMTNLMTRVQQFVPCLKLAVNFWRQSFKFPMWDVSLQVPSWIPLVLRRRTFFGDSSFPRNSHSAAGPMQSTTAKRTTKTMFSQLHRRQNTRRQHRHVSHCHATATASKNSRQEELFRSRSLKTYVSIQSRQCDAL